MNREFDSPIVIKQILLFSTSQTTSVGEGKKEESYSEISQYTGAPFSSSDETNKNGFCERR